MVDFCLHIQPNRAPSLDMADVRRACETIAAAGFVERHKEIVGEDRGPYVNHMFATACPPLLWRALREQLLDDARLGPLLKAASMTMCEGADGWNDYLLLHHFDPDQPLDRL